MCRQSAHSPAALSSLPVEPTSQNTEIDELRKQGVQNGGQESESERERNLNELFDPLHAKVKLVRRVKDCANRLPRRAFNGLSDVGVVGRTNHFFDS
jgi:hypothetical protein